jgi:hypothetical protein
LCSERAVVLKIGTTALITALAGRGLRPGAGLRLAEPVEAMHTVAGDISCKKRLRLASGGETTALEMQRRLLELAERNRDVLPQWTPAVCELWRRTLDELESGPDPAGAALDWAMKLRLFRARTQRAGFSEERVAFCNSILSRLRAALGAAGVEGELRLNAATGPGSPIPGEAAACGSALAAQMLSWNDVDRFLRLRAELCQIDTRFGQLGPRGIFGEMDRRGALDHKVAGVDGIEEAMKRPPATGRAKLRGEMVRRFQGSARTACNWSAVHAPDGRTLDLSDPFGEAEIWIDPNAAPDAGGAQEELLFEDSSGSASLQQMFAAMRRRYGRPRTGSEGASETTEGPGR